MAHDVTLMGATYPDVPAILVPSGQGTARYTDVTDTTATAADVLAGKQFYAADGTLTAGTGGGGGIVIPDGMGYYNGYLLPQIPSISGRKYAWIRDNAQNDTYDLVLGTGVWYTKSGSATLDNWQLMFNNYATDLSYQYSIPRDGTATDWGEYATSANYYGTANNRKVIWSSHDIKIASVGGNVLYRHGIAILPPKKYAIRNQWPSYAACDKDEAAEGETVTVTQIFTRTDAAIKVVEEGSTPEVVVASTGGFVPAGTILQFAMPAFDVYIDVIEKPR